MKAKLVDEEYSPKKKLKKTQTVKKPNKKTTEKTEDLPETETKLTEDSKESVSLVDETVNEVDTLADDPKQELSNPDEQDVKCSQTELDNVETNVNNGETAPKKTKKKIDDGRPRRKYMRRNAYSHDSNHYTVVTNDEGEQFKSLLARLFEE